MQAAQAPDKKRLTRANALNDERHWRRASATPMPLNRTINCAAYAAGSLFFAFPPFKLFGGMRLIDGALFVHVHHFSERILELLKVCVRRS